MDACVDMHMGVRSGKSIGTSLHGKYGTKVPDLRGVVANHLWA